jgi:hypothetical protein
MSKVDYYAYELNDIEKMLGIREMDHSRIDMYTHSTLLDEWNEVEEEIKRVKDREDWNTTVSILGYEIVHEHYIKLYYRVYVSNS